MEGYSVSMKVVGDPVLKKKRVYYGDRYEYHWFENSEIVMMYSDLMRDMFTVNALYGKAFCDSGMKFGNKA